MWTVDQPKMGRFYICSLLLLLLLLGLIIIFVLLTSSNVYHPVTAYLVTGCVTHTVIAPTAATNAVRASVYC